MKILLLLLASMLPSNSRFDSKFYEHWRVAHHLAPISYRDSKGHLMELAKAWEQHSTMCGGVMTEIVFNRRTFELVQAYQGCYLAKSLITGEITYHEMDWWK